MTIRHQYFERLRPASIHHLVGAPAPLPGYSSRPTVAAMFGISRNL
jgi:hypothetical protein